MAKKQKEPLIKPLVPGKVPNELLKKMLAKLPRPSPDVVVGPAVGVDAAVVKVTGKMLAVTSDPITLAVDVLAYYCVHVNANDLAVMGAEPQFMTVVCLLPVGSDAATVRRLGRDLAQSAEQLDLSIIGGHTEITPVVNEPVMVGTMLGRLTARRPISSSGAKPGDVVVMTKYAALEATAIIARERRNRLVSAGLSSSAIRRAQNLLFRPGISILPEARISARLGCSAMHDATEGGLVTALWELAAPGGVRIEVDLSAIPVLPITAAACRPWNIDPLRAISSGAMLTTISEGRVRRLLRELDGSGIEASVIGRVVAGKGGAVDSNTGERLEPIRDEIAKLYQ